MISHSAGWPKQAGYDKWRLALSDGWSANLRLASQLKLDISALTLAASQAINTTIPFKPIL
jgi:hypothetical protein